MAGPNINIKRSPRISQQIDSLNFTYKAKIRNSQPDLKDYEAYKLRSTSVLIPRLEDIHFVKTGKRKSRDSGSLDSADSISSKKLKVSRNEHIKESPPIIATSNKQANSRNITDDKPVHYQKKSTKNKSDNQSPTLLDAKYDASQRIHDNSLFSGDVTPLKVPKKREKASRKQKFPPSNHLKQPFTSVKPTSLKGSHLKTSPAASDKSLSQINVKNDNSPNQQSLVLSSKSNESAFTKPSSKLPDKFAFDTADNRLEQLDKPSYIKITKESLSKSQKRLLDSTDSSKINSENSLASSLKISNTQEATIKTSSASHVNSSSNVAVSVSDNFQNQSNKMSDSSIVRNNNKSSLINREPILQRYDEFSQSISLSNRSAAVTHQSVTKPSKSNFGDVLSHQLQTSQPSNQQFTSAPISSSLHVHSSPTSNTLTSSTSMKPVICGNSKPASPPPLAIIPRKPSVNALFDDLLAYIAKRRNNPDMIQWKPDTLSYSKWREIYPPVVYVDVTSSKPLSTTPPAGSPPPSMPPLHKAPIRPLPLPTSLVRPQATMPQLSVNTNCLRSPICSISPRVSSNIASPGIVHSTPSSGPVILQSSVTTLHNSIVSSPIKNTVSKEKFESPFSAFATVASRPSAPHSSCDSEPSTSASIVSNPSMMTNPVGRRSSSLQLALINSGDYDDTVGKPLIYQELPQNIQKELASLCDNFIETYYQKSTFRISRLDILKEFNIIFYTEKPPTKVAMDWVKKISRLHNDLTYPPLTRKICGQTFTHILPPPQECSPLKTSSNPSNTFKKDRKIIHVFLCFHRRSKKKDAELMQCNKCNSWTEMMKKGRGCFDSDNRDSKLMLDA